MTSNDLYTKESALWLKLGKRERVIMGWRLLREFPEYRAETMAMLSQDDWLATRDPWDLHELFEQESVIDWTDQVLQHLNPVQFTDRSSIDGLVTGVEKIALSTGNWGYPLTRFTEFAKANFDEKSRLYFASSLITDIIGMTLSMKDSPTKDHYEGLGALLTINGEKAPYEIQRSCIVGLSVGTTRILAKYSFEDRLTMIMDLVTEAGVDINLESPHDDGHLLVRLSQSLKPDNYHETVSAINIFQEYGLECNKLNLPISEEMKQIIARSPKVLRRRLAEQTGIDVQHLEDTQVTKKKPKF